MQKRNRNKIIISSLVILGVVLILVGSFGSDLGKSTDSYEEYVSSQERKIEEFLKNVDGIKEVNVIITLEEYSIYDDSSGSYFSESEGESTSIPQVRGVAVACTNGDKYEVQKTVTEIISKYLGISTNRIKIVAKS